MPVAKSLHPPEWIQSGAEITGGLDLLGLRLPVQFIGCTLIDGVTTVTPSVRHLAFRACLVLSYGQTGQADDWQTYTDFAARIDSALVLGNLTQDRAISGPIKADQALARLAGGMPQAKVSSSILSPASTICPGPSNQPEQSKTRGNLVPAQFVTRDLPRVLAVHERPE